jgi:putative membrane protein insertion efficiency factor
MTRGVRNPLQWALILLIRAYQSVHLAFFRGSCRFYPTCSQYAAEAVELHGALKGSWLAACRLVRCQPFCRGGFDPVPEPETKLTAPSRGWSLLAPTAPRRRN